MIRLRAFVLLAASAAALAGCTGGGAEPSTTDAADLSTVVVEPVATTETSATTIAETTSTTSGTTVAPTTPPGGVATTVRLSVSSLPSGLFCRDIVPLGFDYADAVAYWVSEGSPDRMDADLNGIPCETVYAEAEVLAFWGDPLPTTTTLGGTEARRWFGPPDPWGYPDPESPDSGLYGSGCSPGATDLPDGIWFGIIDSHGETQIEFDLACLVIPGPDDEGGASVRNDNPAIRTISVDPDVPVHYVEGGWVAGLATYRDWLMRGCAWRAEQCAVWLYVNDGDVTAIAEHFFTG